MGDQWPAARMQGKPVPKERAEYKCRDAEDRRERCHAAGRAGWQKNSGFLGF